MVLLRVILTVLKPLSDKCMVALVLIYLHAVSCSPHKRSLSTTLRIHHSRHYYVALYQRAAQQHNFTALHPITKVLPATNSSFQIPFFLPPQIFYPPLVSPSAFFHQNCTLSLVSPLPPRSPKTAKNQVMLLMLGIAENQSTQL